MSINRLALIVLVSRARGRYANTNHASTLLRVVSMVEPQVAKMPRKTRCHFDRREKSFLDPSHPLGMTGFDSSPWRLYAFARDTFFRSLLHPKIPNLFGWDLG